MSFNQPKTSPIVYLSIAIACLGHFFVDLMLGIWPVYKTIAGLDLAIAGLIAGLSAFIGEGLQMYFGSFSDKGYRKMLLLSGILLTVCSTFFAYTENYYLLFLFYLITCLGSGAFHPSAAGLMGKLTENRKGLFISIFVASGAAGMAISQLVFTQVFDMFRGHVAILGILPVVLVSFALIRSFDAKDSQAVDTSDGKSHFGEYLRLFQNRDLMWLYVTQLCNASIFWGVVFLIPDVLKSRDYDIWIAFGGGHFFFILGSALMMIPGGYLADKYNPRAVILGTTAVGFVSYYFFLLNPMLSDTAVLSILFVMGAVIGAVNPVVVSFGNRLVPRNPSMVSAFLMGLVWCIAECLGPGGGGFLATLFVEDAPAKALGILGIFFVIGFLATLPLPKVVKEATSDFATQTEF